jgi:hypothetical protein
MPSRFAVLLLCVVLFGRLALTAPRPKTFHISGTITRQGRISSGVLVRFDGNSSITVKANDAGFYEADVPVGLWTVAATIPDIVSPTGTPENFNLSRPRRFRVTNPSNVVIDIFLRPPVVCDIAGPSDTTAEQWEHIHAHCDGEEFFPVPSKDGVPFEVLIGGLDHDLCWHRVGAEAAACNREFTTYNLLTVQADKIAYDPRESLLEASGNVVVKDEHGQYRQDSIRFLIGDGRAVPAY